jgi:UDP-N-acetylmuramate--alanine ligase
MKHVYFIGIGGIGMSAIARYYHHAGHLVSGYDRTPSKLTAALESEGIAIHYEDRPDLIPASVTDTLVIYTPAIPASLQELQVAKERGYRLIKRSLALGEIAKGQETLAIAGTHGKTTTSTLLGHLLTDAKEGCNAFLGGISKNFNGNMVLGEGTRLAVEADEFDRSFLRLRPDVAVITSVAPDHLDIYGTFEAVVEAFGQFAALIKKGGDLVLKQGVEIPLPEGIDIWRYSYDNPASDFHATNITLCEGGYYQFDIATPFGPLRSLRLGIPGWVNVENCVAAVASAVCASRKRGEKLDEELLRAGLAAFSGVKRRFEFYVNTPRQVYMDDYAHHPEELEATITSARRMFPSRRITAVFQPHLYTRTRDLYREFAEALSHADEVVLVPIYPAREEPIEGICSELIGEYVTVDWSLCERESGEVSV